MDSNNFENYIAAYIDGELSAQQRSEFEELMERDEPSKIKFEQTRDLLNDLGSMPKLKTNDNFLSELHKKIEAKEKSRTNFFNKFSEYFLDAKPAFSFAMSFGAIAIFTFIYLNDLRIFDQGIAINKVPKSILKEQKIDIDLAHGNEEDDFAIEEDAMLSEDFDENSQEDSLKDSKVKFKLKEVINDVIKEIKVNRAFTKENE